MATSATATVGQGSPPPRTPRYEMHEWQLRDVSETYNSPINTGKLLRCLVAGGSGSTKIKEETYAARGFKLVDVR